MPTDAQHEVQITTAAVAASPVRNPLGPAQLACLGHQPQVKPVGNLRPSALPKIAQTFERRRSGNRSRTTARELPGSPHLSASTATPVREDDHRAIIFTQCGSLRFNPSARMRRWPPPENE